ncbi:MAG: hypothetical protein AAFW89_06305, partial [Bacteroidota bacterium]
MSWFFGGSGDISIYRSRILSNQLPFQLLLDDENRFVCAGGPPTTTILSAPSIKCGFAVCGTGISRGIPHRYLSKSDWSHLLNTKPEHIQNQNGHFAICAWESSGISLYTDAVGLRGLFIWKKRDTVLFSTHLELLTRVTGERTINWKQLGSQWLGLNPFDATCFFSGIQRIGPSSVVHLTQNDVRVHVSPLSWNSDQSSTPESVIELLSSILTLPFSENEAVSLGLSGGLDSRFLLGLLMQNPHQTWGIHTFGEEKNPDRLVARRLATITDKAHRTVNLILPKTEDLIPEL